MQFNVISIWLIGLFTSSSHSYTARDTDYYVDKDEDEDEAKINLVHYLSESKFFTLTQARAYCCSPKQHINQDYVTLSHEYNVNYYSQIQLCQILELFIFGSYSEYFLVDRESTPARVSLGVTTVLTMTTLMSSTNAQLPKVSYAKGIDVYLGTCFVMVFASLLEYAAVGYSSKRLKMRAAKAGRPLPPSQQPMHHSSIGGSGSHHTAGSPTKALQHVLGSNHSLHQQHHNATAEHQPLTCRNALGSPSPGGGHELGNPLTGERFAEHGSLHGRRSVVSAEPFHFISSSLCTLRCIDLNSLDQWLIWAPATAHF